jgi:PAS domain S-box-containing protein
MAAGSTDALCRWIVESAVDGVVCADRDGIIRVWNRGAQAFLGYAADEAIGQSLNLILPERCRECHWQAFHRWFATGEDRIEEPLGVIPLVHRDSREVQVESTFVRVRDDRGAPKAAGAILRPVGASSGRFEGDGSWLRRTAARSRV